MWFHLPVCATQFINQCMFQKPILLNNPYKYDQVWHLNALKQSWKCASTVKKYNSLQSHVDAKIFHPLSFHIRRKQMFHRPPASSIIYLMECWKCVSATTQILYKTRCAPVAFLTPCRLYSLLDVLLLLLSLHVFSPDDIKDVAFCWPVMDPQQSASDQHCTAVKAS